VFMEFLDKRKQAVLNILAATNEAKPKSINPELGMSLYLTYSIQSN